jgi:Protein kinase domain
MSHQSPIEAYQKGALDLQELMGQIERTAIGGSDAERTAILDTWRRKEIRELLHPQAVSAISKKMEESFGAAVLAPPSASVEGAPTAEEPSQQIRKGYLLNKRFLLDEMLGSGGMGMVFRAIDKRKEEAKDRNPYVAIKLLSQDFREHPDSFIALQREARKCQTLSHPNIVAVYDFDRDESVTYMTMEYLVGSSLDRMIASPDRPRMSTDQMIHIVQMISAALGYAHENGIVHSDLKPANIFVTESGRVKVIDFGIARAVSRPDKASDKAGSVAEKTIFDAGKLNALTPAYASVEMILGEPPDVRDDIFALGCIAYELFTGKHPFRRLQATEARARMMRPIRPDSLRSHQWKALQRALAFEREKRTGSAAEFARELSRPTYLVSHRRPILVTGGVVLVASAGIYVLEMGNRGSGQDSLQPKGVEQPVQDADGAARRAAAERAAAEAAQRAAAEKAAAAEAQRVAAEKAAAAEAQRAAAEKAAAAEAQRVAAEKAAAAEAQRAAAEKAAAEASQRAAAEKAAAEAAQRAAAEKAAAEAAQKVAAQKAAAEAAQRAAAEKAAAEEARRVAAQKAAVEAAQRAAAEKAAAEEARRVAAQKAAVEAAQKAAAQKAVAEAAQKAAAQKAAAEAAQKAAAQKSAAEAAQKAAAQKTAAEAAQRAAAEKAAAAKAQYEAELQAYNQKQQAYERERSEYNAKAAAQSAVQKAAAEAAQKAAAQKAAAEAAAQRAATEKAAAEAAQKAAAQKAAADAAQKAVADKAAADAAKAAAAKQAANAAAQKAAADKAAADAAKAAAAKQAADAAAQKAAADKAAADAAKAAATQKLASAAPPALTPTSLMGSWCSGGVRLSLDQSSWTFRLPDGSMTVLPITSYQVSGDTILVFSQDNQQRGLVTEFGNFSANQMTQIRGRLVSAAQWNNYARPFTRC